MKIPVLKPKPHLMIIIQLHISVKTAIGGSVNPIQVLLLKVKMVKHHISAKTVTGGLT